MNFTLKIAGAVLMVAGVAVNLLRDAVDTKQNKIWIEAEVERQLSERESDTEETVEIEEV